MSAAINMPAGHAKHTPQKYVEIIAATIEAAAGDLACLAKERLAGEDEQRLLQCFELPIDTLVLRLQVNRDLSFFLPQEGHLLFFYRYPGTDAVAFGQVEGTSDVVKVLKDRQERPNTYEQYAYRICAELLQEIERAASLPLHPETHKRLKRLVSTFQHTIDSLG